MTWREVFDGQQMKMWPMRHQVAHFVYTYTWYKLFAFNGRIFSIDDSNGDFKNLKPEEIKITELGTIEELIKNK